MNNKKNCNYNRQLNSVKNSTNCHTNLINSASFWLLKYYISYRNFMSSHVLFYIVICILLSFVCYQCVAQQLHTAIIRMYLSEFTVSTASYDYEYYVLNLIEALCGCLNSLHFITNRARYNICIYVCGSVAVSLLNLGDAVCP